MEGSWFYVLKISRKCFGDAGEIRRFRICWSCAGEAIPSLGSYGHPNICRRPCILLMRGACQKGADCGFCHLAHDAWRNSVYAATAVYKSFHEVCALSIWDILGATVFFPR